MNFELIGEILEISDTKQITDTFKKREFVLEIEETFNGKAGMEIKQIPIKFEMKQAKCDDLDKFSVGEKVKVNFAISGRAWTKDGNTTFFNSLDAGKVERLQEAVNVLPAKVSPKMNGDMAEQFNESQMNDTDDLPF